MRATDLADKYEENPIAEDDFDDDKQLFSGLEKHEPKPLNLGRDRSDSLKKNIKKYEQSRKKNLNDSRENDFEGFDELEEEWWKSQQTVDKLLLKYINKVW